MKHHPFFYSRLTFLLLPLLALAYYGYYYRCGLYPCGEGGVEGVTALRLLSGKIPITEVALNYNLLWFYPIIWLFKIFGPSYTVIRIFFFSLCTITSLLAYGIVWQTTRHAWLAMLAGVIALLLPGQLFRNYMAFSVMLNMAVFLKAYLLPCRNRLIRLAWVIASGFTLGLAFLIRIDLGFFLSAILLGLILIYPFCQDFKKIWSHFLISLAALFLVTFGVISIHEPVYHEAREHNFVTPFLQQYQQWPHMIVSQGSHLFSLLFDQLKKQPPSAVSATPVTAVTVSAATIGYQTSPSKTTLTRRSFNSSDIREQLMAFNLYLPVCCAFLLSLIGIVFFFTGTKTNNLLLKQRGIILLTCLGCSLSLFPQYFFWRPDMIHLSEFMVPMNMTLLLGIAFVCKAWKTSKKLMRILLLAFFLIAGATLVLYLITGIQSQSTGGIAISQHRTLEFHGENCVDVKLTSNEFEETSAIYKSIMGHSGPNDYVICFPYNPEINFMTDRPSYRRDLYIDNITAPKTFDHDAIAEIEKYHPAAIAINNWPINGTEESRFKNWAAETYHYLQTHYVLDYQKGIIEVFVRPSSIQPHTDPSNGSVQKP